MENYKRVGGFIRPRRFFSSNMYDIDIDIREGASV
jgi:hypothetical protein